MLKICKLSKREGASENFCKFFETSIKKNEFLLSDSQIQKLLTIIKERNRYSFEIGKHFDSKSFR